MYVYFSSATCKIFFFLFDLSSLCTIRLGNYFSACILLQVHRASWIWGLFFIKFEIFLSFFSINFPNKLSPTSPFGSLVTCIYLIVWYFSHVSDSILFFLAYLLCFSWQGLYLLVHKLIIFLSTTPVFLNPQFRSVTQSCPTLWDPMNCSTPGLPVHHQLPEFTQTHVHQVSDAIQPSHPLLSPSPPAPNPSQHQGLFQWVNSSYEMSQVLEFQLQHQSFQWTPRTDLL